MIAIFIICFCLASLVIGLGAGFYIGVKIAYQCDTQHFVDEYERAQRKIKLKSITAK